MTASDKSEETTPIHDEVKNGSAAEPTDAALSQDQKVAPDAERTEVEMALARETHDGKGDEDPGPSDWNGFATEGVEEETQ